MDKVRYACLNIKFVPGLVKYIAGKCLILCDSFETENQSRIVILILQIAGGLKVGKTKCRNDGIS